MENKKITLRQTITDRSGNQEVKTISTYTDEAILNAETSINSKITALNSSVSKNTANISAISSEISKLKAEDIVIDIADPIGPVLDETFANNSWENISWGLANGNPAKWALGAEKPLALTNGATYTIRLCDMLENRYECVDSSQTQHAVLEFKECFKTEYLMNSSYTNSGGWADSKMKTASILNIWNLLPDDFKSIVLNVKLLSTTGGGNNNATTSESENKIWLPSALEMFSTWNDGDFLKALQAEMNGKPQFQLYAQNDTDSFRIKNRNGKSDKWWLRSPCPSNSNYFCQVGSDGSSDYHIAGVVWGVSPCFAI